MFIIPGDEIRCNMNCLDSSKIKRFVPGFHTTIKFSEGIKRTIRWFEEKPERMQMDPAKGELVDRILNAYKSL